MDQRVSFFIVGAGKSGTTWLYRALKHHPEISLSYIKEMNFFSKYFEKGDDYYHHLFPRLKPGCIRGDISPKYMIHESAPERIWAYNPGAKIVFTLRHPVDRAFSEYCMWLRAGRASLDCREELAPGSRFVEGSCYFRYIKAYIDLFGDEQVGIYFYRDMKACVQRYYSDICTFIGVNPNHIPSVLHSRIHGRKPIPSNIALYNSMVNTFKLLRKKNRFLSEILGWSKDMMNDAFHRVMDSSRAFPHIDNDTKKLLLDYFSEDISKLEQHCDVDLSHWRTN